MSLEACESCGTYDAVMWSLKDGHTCLPCEDKRRAIIRQAELDAAAAKKQQEEDAYKFFHE